MLTSSDLKKLAAARDVVVNIEADLFEKRIGTEGDLHAQISQELKVLRSHLHWLDDLINGEADKLAAKIRMG